MSQGFGAVTVKQEIMIDGYASSQSLFPHGVEPTASAYLPERHSMSSPILEIGTVTGNWTGHNSDLNMSSDSDKMELDKSPSNIKEVKIFVCHVCDYKTRQKQSLITHQRNHTGEKPYTCTHCRYRTGKPGNLTVHIRKHTGEKPYACDQCEYRGTQRISLINHKRTHTGEKPYVCDVCDYRTGFRGNLSQHKRKHTGEKPFACGQCDYKSSQRTPWMAHIKKSHAAGPFPCDLCGFSSDIVEELAEHRKTHGILWKNSSPQLGPDETSTVQELSNLRPLLAGETVSDAQPWPNQQRCSNEFDLIIAEAHPNAKSTPSAYQAVRAFDTTLRWARDNETKEEIELLQKMRRRALVQHLKSLGPQDDSVKN